MAEHIFRRIREENSKMNTDFTAQIYNEALIMIEDLCLEIENNWANRSAAAASFYVELRCEQNYNAGDLLSYVQSNIPKLTLEQKGKLSIITGLEKSSS
jgi:hypothetical protein